MAAARRMMPKRDDLAPLVDFAKKNAFNSFGIFGGANSPMPTTRKECHQTERPDFRRHLFQARRGYYTRRTFHHYSNDKLQRM